MLAYRIELESTIITVCVGLTHIVPGHRTPVAQTLAVPEACRPIALCRRQRATLSNLQVKKIQHVALPTIHICFQDTTHGWLCWLTRNGQAHACPQLTKDAVQNGLRHSILGFGSPLLHCISLSSEVCPGSHWSGYMWMQAKSRSLQWKLRTKSSPWLAALYGLYCVTG